MKFSPGESVLKTPCPSGCTCDGSAIPPGSPGTISKPHVKSMQNSDGGFEPYYTVNWSVNGRGRMWGTFEHGIMSADTFPDISYLEDV